MSSWSVSLLLFSVVVFCASCDGVRYDFGDPPDTGSESPSTDTGALCGELVVTDGECAVSGSLTQWCMSALSLETVQLTQTLGCTPEGQSLGLVSLRTVDGQVDYDLFAWSARSDDSGYFDEDVSLALFRDACGDEPLGDSPECDYRPWLYASGLPVNDELIMHVQTSKAGTADVEFQLIRNGAWGKSPPFAGFPYGISCEEVASEHVYADLLDGEPWEGEPVYLNLSAQPPSLDGEPWMCGLAASPLRQVGFLLRNAGDTEYQLRGVTLKDAQGDLKRFNHGLFECNDTGVVPPGDEADSMGCELSKVHEMNLIIPKWDPGAGVHDRVLLLQVPPGVGTELYLTIDAVELLPPAL